MEGNGSRKLSWIAIALGGLALFVALSGRMQSQSMRFNGPQGYNRPPAFQAGPGAHAVRSAHKIKLGHAANLAHVIRLARAAGLKVGCAGAARRTVSRSSSCRSSCSAA